MKRIATLFSVVVAIAGCGPFYAYVPTPPALTVKAFNRDGAFYSIPKDSPHGDLRVVSYGVEKLTSGDPDAPSSDDTDFHALHLRVAIENTGQTPWTFDTRDQQVLLEGHGAESAAFVASDRAGDGSRPPVLTLSFGVTRIVDLFYPLPPELDSASKLPAYQAITKVQTDEGEIAETTVFRRAEISAWDVPNDVLADGEYDYTEDPFWSNVGFVGFGGARHSWHGHVYSRGSGSTNNNYRRGGGYSSGGRSGGRIRATPSVSHGSSGARHR